MINEQKKDCNNHGTNNYYTDSFCLPLFGPDSAYKQGSVLFILFWKYNLLCGYTGVIEKKTPQKDFMKYFTLRHGSVYC